jgi:dephospho-CoA kinase
MIVGLTGPNAAGKGEVARFLTERGFAYHSLSDVVREEAGARGLDHSRENLIRVGNELRSKVGPGVLADRIAARLRGDGGAPEGKGGGRGPGGRTVIDSVRSPAEVTVLRTLPGFILLGVNAPIEVRFARSRSRARIGDGATIEEFVRKEALENSTDPAAQQLGQTFALADVVVLNDGTIQQLRSRVAAALSI